MSIIRRMRVEIKISPKVWRVADAVINSSGHAVVKLPHPYGTEIFKHWREIKPRRNGKKPTGAKKNDSQ